MAFRSADESLVVGSTTAGADGNVSHFVLPGELRSMISGIGVFLSEQSRDPTHRHRAECDSEPHNCRNPRWEGRSA